MKMRWQPWMEWQKEHSWELKESAPPEIRKQYEEYMQERERVERHIRGLDVDNVPSEED